VQKIADALNDAGLPIKGSRLLLLGMAYKPDVHDTRESPSFEVMRQLLARHAEVRYCDPWVPEIELDGERHHSVEWSPKELAECDCAVLLTAHRRFLDPPLWENEPLVVDTRGAVPEGPGVKPL
jgi:UDP-N-acetyl-D-glucosamine dehydrogenase